MDLKAGETKTIEFLITPKQYAELNEEGQPEFTKGSLMVSVGGKQPNFEGLADAETTSVLTKTIELKE